MLIIFQAYLDIALMRRGPQSLPASLPLLWLTVLALGVLALIPIPGQAVSALQTGAEFIIHASMLASIIWLLLNAMQLRGRFVQTMTALFGAELILTLLKLAVLVVFPGTFEDFRQTQRPNPPLMLLIGLEAWSLAVMSAILRAAMSIGVMQSIGIIILILVLYLGAAGLLLPGLAAAA